MDFLYDPYRSGGRAIMGRPTFCGRKTIAVGCRVSFNVWSTGQVSCPTIKIIWKVSAVKVLRADTHFGTGEEYGSCLGFSQELQLRALVRDTGS